MTMLEEPPAKVLMDSISQVTVAVAPNDLSRGQVIGLLIEPFRISRRQAEALYDLVDRAVQQTAANHSYMLRMRERYGPAHVALGRIMPDDVVSQAGTRHRLLEDHFSSDERRVRFVHSKQKTHGRFGCTIEVINVAG